MLEFVENSKGKKSEMSYVFGHHGSPFVYSWVDLTEGMGINSPLLWHQLRWRSWWRREMNYSQMQSMSTYTFTRLGMNWNAFCCRLILATPPTEDPVELLRETSRDHIPVNPSQKMSGSTLSKQDKGNRCAVPASEDRPAIDDIIREIMKEDWYKEQIVERRSFDSKDGVISRRGFGLSSALTWPCNFLASPNPPLSETILQALQSSRKITSLYSHQAAAIDAVARGQNVIVSTSTASGKSVIYQVSHNTT